MLRVLLKRLIIFLIILIYLDNLIYSIFSPNFEIISPDDIHFNFSVKDYNISPDKVEFFKGKYIKHNLIKEMTSFFNS